MPVEQIFSPVFGITRGDVVCLVGAGGKTSLLFCLAQEARERGERVLLTTTTRLAMPHEGQYDNIDLTGSLFADRPVSAPGIYVGVQPCPVPGKVMGASSEVLAQRRKAFDLVLIEADGAAQRNLKGWLKSEPVIPDFTTKTIGIIDMQTIGLTIDNNLVHRCELFCRMVQAQPGDAVSVSHLARVITSPQGLFQYARGERCVFGNKVENSAHAAHAKQLHRTLGHPIKMVAGSLHEKTLTALCEGTVHG